MDRFHKWCYEAVLGLGVLCLWYEIAMLSFRLFENWTPGFLIGMFFIGWALTYKDNKEKEERMAHNIFSKKWQKNVKKMAKK